MNHKKCPCCGSKIFFLKYKEMYDKDFANKEKFEMASCKKCGLDFLTKKMTEQELQKVYPEEEYYSYQEYNKLAFFYHKASAYYYSKKNPLFNLILFWCKPMFYTYYINSGKKILEVGCGNGMKLEIYKRYGMKTQGIEPYGPKLSEKEKKLGIIKIPIGQAKFPKESFDYIILKEVLEHVPNQNLVIKKCHEWLKREGKLIITVPNTFGILKKIFKQNWYGYDVPRHLYNYNPKNLHLFLKKYDFKKIKIRIYEMPYMLDGSLKFYFTDKKGKREHPIIFSNIMKIFWAPLSLIMSYLKIGSIIEAECTK